MYKILNGKKAEMTQEEIDELLAQQPPVDLPALRAERIADSKTALATYLESHPLTWSDGKAYTVTAEKQALLNNALAVYQLATASGQPTELRWNATGESVRCGLTMTSVRWPSRSQHMSSRWYPSSRVSRWRSTLLRPQRR